MPLVTEMVKKVNKLISQFVLETNDHQPPSPSHMNEKAKVRANWLAIRFC